VLSDYRVVQHLADNIADYDIACLETDRPGFYEQLGGSFGVAR
jgi:hypothetical protein